MSKPTLPQGTRDFAPETVRKRTFILNTIKNVFEVYGYQPLETPAVENLETLMGKYGEEGDKLIFRILNNGLGDPKNIDRARSGFEQVLAGRNDRNLTERALRYDLTIPFARYVAMNQAHIAFPFRRYQIQPVWRADRPQKGRYREFYQCDADVVGSTSLFNEVEFVYIYNEVFRKLGISDFGIKINSRKILSALVQKCGGAANLVPITVAIDKLDKVGPGRVREELAARGLSSEQIELIDKYLAISGDNTSRLQQVRELTADVPEGAAGCNELEFILDSTGAGNTRDINDTWVAENTKNPKSTSGREPAIPLTVDFTLARGLNYYTGVIFEIRPPAAVRIGSIGGGGRYDDLTGLFGLPGIPGVGISFGVDRIYDVMEELSLFPDNINISTQVLFLNAGPAQAADAFARVQQLRGRGISAELYPDSVKVDRQFKYAEKKNIPFVVSAGDPGQYRIKNIRSGKAETVNAEELFGYAFEVKTISV